MVTFCANCGKEREYKDCCKPEIELEIIYQYERMDHKDKVARVKLDNEDDAKTLSLIIGKRDGYICIVHNNI